MMAMGSQNTPNVSPLEGSSDDSTLTNIGNIHGQSDFARASHPIDIQPVVSLNETQAPIAAAPHGVATMMEASSYILRAGTVIPALLLTAANSDLPGQLVAQVTRDVYDSHTQQMVLIPKGTKLLGRYDTHIAGGQQRLMVAWTRLLFPNGRAVTVPVMDGTDQRGAAGVPGDVDNHYRRLFANALLLSTVSAGLQLSQPQQSTVYTAPNSRQITAGAVGQELGDVATQLIRKHLDIPPTISLVAGQSLIVMLNGDLSFPTPYIPTF
jgi:type IV secretion system protein VirB10